MVRFALASLALMSASSTISLSADLIRVSEVAWIALTTPERTAISERHVVSIIPADSAGVIVDAQTINESTPGTTTGAQLGAAYGSALYVDRAFRGPNYNYSATRNLSAGLLGAMAGSMADQRPHAQFHTRYTIRTLDGQIHYRDEVKAEPFRHSLGICIAVAGLQPIDQAICVQTAGALRQRYLAAHAPPETMRTETAASSAPEAPEDGLVLCKFGTSAPVLTARTTCNIAGGESR